MKRFFILILILSILSGCSDTLKGENFLKYTNQIDYSITEGKWVETKTLTLKLKELYKNDKWKLQLLGDEGEYEGLYRSINSLIVACEESDSTNAKLELADIESYIEDIFSL